ncbi:MAG: type II secretion system protein [Candidatus Marinimicrobia bacterium]|nr:type II secretion system protein [Candidatus Neomarinimicrobiota bacterium]
MKFKKNRLGFTLIELVVSTAIMGTLAAVAVPSYIATQAKTKATKTMVNIASIGQAVGEEFNALVGELGEVNLNQAKDTPFEVTNLANCTILADSDGDTSMSFIDLFPSGVPLSPFGDLNYMGEVTNIGSIGYTVDDVGNVTVTAIPAEIRFWDVEDSTGLAQAFSY